MPSLFSIGKSTGRSQSIDELKSLISSKGGLANPTLYRVFLPKSPGNGYYKVDTPELNMLASSVTLPGRQIMTQEREIGGVVQKVANNSATADVNMTFRVLNNYGVRRYFESWQKLKDQRFIFIYHQKKRSDQADIVKMLQKVKQVTKKNIEVKVESINN